MSCPYKGKNVYCPSLYTFPYNVFPYFLEGQVLHKDNKLGIMTNVGKSRLAKVIFTNIHKMSDACAVLVDISWLHNVWEMFLLFIKFRFLWKNSVSEKIKAHLPQHPPALQQLFNPHLFNFIQKIDSPTPIHKRAQRLHSIWEITKERQ